MRYIFSRLILLFIFIGSTSCTRAQIQVFEVLAHGEAFIPDQKALAIIEQPVKYVVVDDFILYITPKIRSYSHLNMDKEGAVEKQTLVRKDTVYLLFATKKNDKYGLHYTLENFRKENGQVERLDSFLMGYLHDEASFKFFEQELGQPTKVTINGRKKSEIYAIKRKSYAEVDSVYRDYDQDLMDLDFSFSKKLDKENNSKLYKTTFIMNAIPKGIIMPDTEIPKRRLWNLVRRVDEKNPEQFLEIIEKFKTDRLKAGIK